MPIAEHRPYLWNEIELLAQIGKIIDAYNAIRFSSPEDAGKRILYLPAYPPYVFSETGQAERVDLPTQLICYDIVEKADGSIGPNKFDSKKRPRPIVAETYEVTDPETGKKMLEEVYIKHYDIRLRFDCLAPTDAQSLALIRDFERMIEIHTPYLEQGVKRFMYEGRSMPYFSPKSRYKSRTCTCFAQVEEHWYKIRDQIQKINIQYLSFSEEIEVQRE